MKVLNKLGRLGKVAVLSAVASVGAFADPIAFDSATKSFTGDFDLGPYYSSIAIVVAAIAIVASIKLALKSFRHV